MSNNSPHRRHYSGRTSQINRNSRPQRTSTPGGYNRPRPNGGRRVRQIDPRRFVNEAIAQIDETPYVSKRSFAEFGFIAALGQTLTHRGYDTPTPIQDDAIPAVMAGRDVIGMANTGTGKTAAFILPIIHRLKTMPEIQNVLIMAPTRELAVQIDEEFKAFARDLKLYSALCVGGVNINRQKSQLARRPQVIIGTPGRLKDLTQQKALDLSHVHILVLDEADRMLDMGFIRDIRFLLALLPKQRQSLCFSATIPTSVATLMNEMLHDPISISVRTTETSNHVQQDVIRAGSKEEKVEILQDLLRKPEFDKVLIFGETKWGVQRLADNLAKQGIATEAIHGNKSQSQRQRALQAFKDGKVGVLVATDVASRGLDIPQVSHVINFDQPESYDDYIHRIGRTGRAGARGHALTFVA